MGNWCGENRAERIWKDESPDEMITMAGRGVVAAGNCMTETAIVVVVVVLDRLEGNI